MFSPMGITLKGSIFCFFPLCYVTNEMDFHKGTHQFLSEHFGFGWTHNCYLKKNVFYFKVNCWWMRSQGIHAVINEL